VSSDIVRVTEPLETRGQQNRKRGNQPTNAPSTAQEEKNTGLRSTLFSLVNG
jgi:hypothetical protein